MLYQSNRKTMTTIYFTARENTMRVNPNSKMGGLLHFDKSDKGFSCDASDLECAGMTSEIPKQFAVKVVESGNSKIFNFFKSVYSKGEDAELQYHIYKSNDGFEFHIFND